MSRKIVVACAFSVILIASAGFAAPVTFNDPNLLAAVQTQYNAETGLTLSTPPDSSELSNPSFWNLDARHLGISDLTGLEACTGLLILRLGYNNISDVDPISGLTQLLALDLGFGVTTDPDFNPFVTGTNQLDNNAISNLAGLIHLNGLNIGGNTAITDITPLATLTGLTDLYLGNNPLGATSFATLVHFPSLQTFVCVQCGLTNALLSNLSGLTGITTLGLSETGITDISALSGLNPSVVLIPNTPITSIAVASNWTNLIQLLIPGTSVTDYTPLTGLTGLQLLSISGTGTSDISPLQSLTGLTYLDLTGCQVTDLQPLVDNTGINSGDTIVLTGNPLTRAANCAQIGELRSKVAPGGSVTTDVDCSVTLHLVRHGVGDVTPAPGDLTYNIGDTVTLSAWPSAGSGQAFEMFAFDISSTNNTVQFPINADMSVDVWFVDGQQTLTVATTGSGSGTVAPFTSNGVYSFLTGQVLNLTAAPASGDFFGGWSGAATGYQYMQFITMDANKSVTADFETTGFNLTTAISSGQGSLNIIPGTWAYAAGASFDIKAYPASGWKFQTWSGDTGSADLTNPILPVTIDADKTINATFEQIPQYTLHMLSDGNGTTNPVGDTSYDSGTVLQVSAIADPGYVFDHWTGDLGGASATDAVINITIDQDRTLTAFFVSADFDLVINTPVGNGTVSPSAGTYYYKSGATVVLTAMANNSGAAFDYWDGDIGTADPNAFVLVLVMDENRVVTPHFATANHVLHLAVSGPGTIYPGPGDYGFLDGRAAGATVLSGFFGGWEGDVTSSLQSFLLVMDADKTVTATFGATGFPLTVAMSGPNGSVLPLPGTYHYAAGASVTLSATVTDITSRFKNWTGDIGTANAGAIEITVPIDQARSVTAVFETIPIRILAVNVSGSGSVINQLGSQILDGKYAPLTATPGPGWRFVQWTGELSANITNPTLLSISLLMDQDRTITAVFEAIPTYTLSTSTSGTGRGSIIVQPLLSSYIEGATVTLIASAGSDSNFINWTGDIGGATATDSSIIVTMSQNRTITAVFNLIPTYTLGVTTGGTGTGTVDVEPLQATYLQGASVTLSATATNGSTFVNWTGDIGTAVATAPSISVTMTQNRAITANFTAATEGEGEGGVTEGEGEGSVCAAGPYETADQNQDNKISLSELLRVIQFFNSHGFHCQATGTEDGYAPGPNGDKTCCPYLSDYNPQDWQISLSELLRVIQFFNSHGYHYTPNANPPTEDGFTPGP